MSELQYNIVMPYGTGPAVATEGVLLDEVRVRVLKDPAARRLGDYQRDILLGLRRLSGSDLRGRARRWSGRYATARANVVALWCKHGGCEARVGSHRTRVLAVPLP